MARARKVISDLGSREVDELRRTVNNLILVLENVASEVDDGSITADEAFTALLTAISTGKDNDITDIDSGTNDYVGSGREVVGLRPQPGGPRYQRVTADELMDKDSDYN